MVIEPGWAYFNAQVRLRIRTAKQNVSLFCLDDAQRIGKSFRIIDFPFQHAATAGTALSATTTIRHQDIGTMRCGQYRLAGIGIENLSFGFERDTVGLGDGISLPAGYAYCSAN